MTPDFLKYINGLLPAVIQDIYTGKVLMLGYMNEEAYAKTIQEKRVFFYSRSKQRLWLKGETSGNYLNVKDILLDCDKDALLIKVIPTGPVCHTGSDTCFNETNAPINFLSYLESIIQDRKTSPLQASHTSCLFQKGINAIAQKLGEEAVELIIESKDHDNEKFINEASDLLYHYLVLLSARNMSLNEVISQLRQRHSK